MTLLSNHRVHSYKASAAHIRRDVSPKKLPHQKVWKKTRTTPSLEHILWVITKKMVEPVEPAAPPSSPMVPPEPSAPPAVMTTRTIYVWGTEYKVELPDFFDIYEGLRLWYPSLYEAVMEEEKNLANLRAMEEGLTEDQVEQAWAHQDYLEWLCD